jgi:hypothetical protein
MWFVSIWFPCFTRKAAASFPVRFQFVSVHFQFPQLYAGNEKRALFLGAGRGWCLTVVHFTEGDLVAHFLDTPSEGFDLFLLTCSET